MGVLETETVFKNFIYILENSLNGEFNKYRSIPHSTLQIIKFQTMCTDLKRAILYEKYTVKNTTQYLVDNHSLQQNFLSVIRFRF